MSFSLWTMDCRGIHAGAAALGLASANEQSHGNPARGKKHPFSNQTFSTSLVWPLKATRQQSQEPRNENLKMTNQTR
jgi:hypothetical protein